MIASSNLGKNEESVVVPWDFVTFEQVFITFLFLTSGSESFRKILIIILTIYMEFLVSLTQTTESFQTHFCFPFFIGFLIWNLKYNRVHIMMWEVIML